MKLIIKNLKQVPHEVEVPSDAVTVKDLKVAIEQKHGFDSNQLKLLFNGVVLDDTKTLASYNIKDGFVIIMMNTKIKPKNVPVTQPEQPKPQEVPKTTTEVPKPQEPKPVEQPRTTPVTTPKKIVEKETTTPVVETKIPETPKKETKVEIKQPETPKCSDSKHGVGVGNSNKWFNSYNEAVSYYDNLILDYSNKIHNGQITFEEYNKQCPCGYEIWSCQYCGKWTLNYYKR